MSRAALSIALLFLARIASAADLPPGAVARLGDDRFRAGSAVSHLALSPDGKQFVTVREAGIGLLAVTTWDASTGKPIREQKVNSELFRGLVWGKGGAFAVACRAEPGPKNGTGELFPDDFRVWDFTDPKIVPPPVISVTPYFELGDWLNVVRPKHGPEYTDFEFSTDGTRGAARWKSADGRHAVHVFELKSAPTAAKLTRIGAIDLGAEGADAVHLSADGKKIVTFRALANPGTRECTATVWDVATGRPGKPVRAPGANRLMLAPDASAIVVYTAEQEEWGFDLFDFATGKRRALTRWRYTAAQLDGGPDDRGAFVFAPSGREVFVAIDRQTFVIDLKTGKELGRLEGHADAPRAVAVSADGATIATADCYGLVRLWGANTLRPFEEVTGHRAPVEHAELSPDGKRLLTWGEDETVRLWDVATGKELRAFAGAPGLFDTNRYLNRPTFTPDGTTVLYSTKTHLVARDLLTSLEVPLPGGMAELEPHFVVFAPDGKAALTWTGNPKYLTVWDWPSGKKRFALEGLLSEGTPGFTFDGAAVFADGCSPQCWDAKTGKELTTAWKDAPNRPLTLLSLRPNPRLLIDRSLKGLRTLEAGTGRLMSEVHTVRDECDGSQGDPRGVALAPSTGQYAWLWKLDEPDVLHLSETVTSELRRTLQGHRGEVRVLGFTPDGTKLLTAGGDHTVLVWDVRLQSVPLPDALKKETSAAKLWDKLASGKADAAYLAMARLAREPDAAVKIVRMRLKPAARGDRETDETRVTDCRAIELLEALGTDSSRAFLKELAAGHAGAFRTQEAKRAMERREEK